MSDQKLKIAFFGTPYVARDTAAILHANNFFPSVVITNPDKRHGRGLELQASPTKVWAQEHNIPVLTLERLDEDAIEKIRSFNCDYAIVVAYGKIFSQELINTFPKGVLNIHYSLLPKYRGASPVETALLNNDKVTGVTIQKMTAKLDAGDIIAVREMEIKPEDTTVTLRPRLITLGAQLLVEVLPKYEADEIPAIPQDDSQASNAKKIQKEDGHLNLTDDPLTNWNKYRAYAESPRTYFFVEKNGLKMRVKITAAKFENDIFTILRIIPEGKKETDFQEFMKTFYSEKL